MLQAAYKDRERTSARSSEQIEQDKLDNLDFAKNVNENDRQPVDLLLTRMEEVHKNTEDLKFTVKEVNAFLNTSYLHNIYFAKLKNPEAMLVAYYHSLHPQQEVKERTINNVQLSKWEIHKYMIYLDNLKKKTEHQ